LDYRLFIFALKPLPFASLGFGSVLGFTAAMAGLQRW